MAAMTTALTEFSDSANSRTYTFTGHTTAQPFLVLQKRKIPTGNQTVVEDTINVVVATTDVSGNILPQKISYEVKFRRPLDADATDLATALSTIRDIVAGDEFTAVTNTSNYLV